MSCLTSPKLTRARSMALRAAMCLRASNRSRRPLAPTLLRTFESTWPIMATKAATASQADATSCSRRLKGRKRQNTSAMKTSPEPTDAVQSCPFYRLPENAWNVCSNEKCQTTKRPSGVALGPSARASPDPSAMTKIKQVASSQSSRTSAPRNSATGESTALRPIAPSRLR